MVRQVLGLAIFIGMAAFAALPARAACSRDDNPPGCGADESAVEKKLNLDTGSYLRASCLDCDAIPFAIGKSTLGKEGKAKLDKAIAWLIAHPERKATLAGHADDPGSDEYNLALGDRRAHRVLDYMTAHGIAATRLSTITFGRFRPLPPDAGRTRNGRVEIVLDK